MNVNRTLLSILLLSCLVAQRCTAGGIEPGVSFVSPNGRFSVHLAEVGGPAGDSTHFIINDALTKHRDQSIEMPTALLYLHWAANSKSFVTVEHIANGSYGRIVYSDGDKWRSVEVRPPYRGVMDAGVITVRLMLDRVHYEFAVRTLTRDWKPLDYRSCDVDVRLRTGKMFNVRWTPLSEAQWASSLEEREPKYVPPITDQTTRREQQ